MDYAKQLLGKSLRDLSFDDIADFFAVERKENELLEFKSISPKAKDSQSWEPVLEGVCAFLNSSGGILIWGAPKGIPGPGKEKVFVGALTGLHPSFEKDMIVNKISSSITPLASDFKVEILRNSDGLAICLIEIDESQYKPHQFQHIYYMRLDGQSRPAPHYFVEALFKRIAIPQIEGYLLFSKLRSMNDSRGTRQQFTITVAIANFSSTQNEENVYYRITSNIARWNLEHWNTSSNPRPENGMKHVVHNDVVPVLANGSPFIKQFWFEFTPLEIGTPPADLTFSLQFGGKKSPPKFSNYRFFFAKTYGTLQPLEKNENMAIGNDETGELSRESQLRAILGKGDLA